MNMELMDALRQIAEERGVPMEMLRDALEAALVSAYRKNFGGAQVIRIDLDSGDNIRVIAEKNIVEVVEDPYAEVSLADAREADPAAEVGSIVEYEVTPREFGRIAAQTAKQVIMQRVREAERDVIYEEYNRRIGEIVTGVVQRMENRHILINLGKTDAVIPPSEQAPQDRYRHNERIKVYVMESAKTPKGPQVKVSRTHPGLVKRLFEIEVPEIHDGIVEVKSVAREAGSRSKIAVVSRDVSVDAVGSCVGAKGSRVQMVVDELKGEKIDIIPWDPDISRFISASLSPAKVTNVKLNADEESAIVVVPDDQLSLAIGKSGQNVRLAVKLTGWKIDIKSVTDYKAIEAVEAQRQKEEMERLMDSITAEMHKEAEVAPETVAAAAPASELNPEELDAALSTAALLDNEDVEQDNLITLADINSIITFDDLAVDTDNLGLNVTDDEDDDGKGKRKKKKSGKSEEEKMLGKPKAKKKSRKAMVEEDEEDLYL
ncbi:MAG: transcription termination factor NusA [bacterium]|nr:transcription termination factor NusA [bacterium]